MTETRKLDLIARVAEKIVRLECAIARYDKWEVFQSLGRQRAERQLRNARTCLLTLKGTGGTCSECGQATGFPRIAKPELDLCRVHEGEAYEDMMDAILGTR